MEQYNIDLLEEYDTITVEKYNMLITGISPNTALRKNYFNKSRK
nr:MAG TPA: hypothetical protein [Caudoviricetes sp.]